jgi:RNA polymerase primary sigma factor
MNIKEILKKLTKIAAKEGFISQEAVLEYAPLDSDLYFEIERELLNLNIDIIDAEDEETVEVDVKSSDDDDDDDKELDDEPDEMSLSDLDIEESVDLETDLDTIAHSVKIDDPVRMYLKEIGQIPLLNIDEEKKYAVMVAEGQIAKEQLDLEVNGDITYSDEDKQRLNDAIDKAQYAKNKLVEANYRLVVSIAKNILIGACYFLI